MKTKKTRATLTKEELIEILETLEEPIKTTFKTKEEALKNIYAGNFIITSENEMTEAKSLLSILSELVHKYKLVDNRHPVSITANLQGIEESKGELEDLLLKTHSTFSDLDLEIVSFEISKLTQDLTSLIGLRLNIINNHSNKMKDYDFIQNVNDLKRKEKEVYRSLSYLKIGKLRGYKN